MIVRKVILTLLIPLLAGSCGGGGPTPPLICGPVDDGDVVSCPDGYACQDAVCVCVPSCIGRECGDDGCGGSCGDCPAGEVCFRHPWAPTAECCVPHCEEGWECGDDGCGGSCGGCPKEQVCRLNGTCCVQQCDERQCGDDGCDGNCGLCPDGYDCVESPGSAVCEADCGWFCEAYDCGITGHHGECKCGGCGDQNPCTIDECKSSFCVHHFIEGCCVSDEDCLDCVDSETGQACPPDSDMNPTGCLGANCVPNTCTENYCDDDGFCDIDPASLCCVDDWDCDDENPCSEDFCVQETHFCIRVFEPGCCANDGMCNDGDICTLNICDLPIGEVTGTCEFPANPTCCEGPWDCAPQSCKEAHCQNGNCIYVDTGEACLHDLQCSDNDSCTIDKCINECCTYFPSGVEGCD